MHQTVYLEPGNFTGRSQTAAVLARKFSGLILHLHSSNDHIFLSTASSLSFFSMQRSIIALYDCNKRVSLLVHNDLFIYKDEKDLVKIDTESVWVHLAK